MVKTTRQVVNYVCSRWSVHPVAATQRRGGHYSRVPGSRFSFFPIFAFWPTSDTANHCPGNGGRPSRRNGQSEVGEVMEVGGSRGRLGRLHRSNLHHPPPTSMTFPNLPFSGGAGNRTPVRE